MKHPGKAASGALAAVLAAAALVTAAQAAPNCGLVGKWHYDSFHGFGSGEAVNDCSIVIKATGAFTGQCTSWTLGESATSGPFSGRIKADRKCQLSGFTGTPGPNTVTIRGGHVRGTIAVFVGTRGDPDSPNNVRLVTLTKQ